MSHAKLVWFSMGILALTACPGGRGGPSEGDAYNEEAVESTLENSLSYVVTTADLSSGAAELDAEARSTSSSCYDATYVTCSFCYELDGNPFAGEYTSGIEQDECSGTVDVRDTSVTFTLSDLQISGAWSGDIDGNYDIDGTGSIAAQLDVDGPASSDPQSFTSSAALDFTVSTANWAYDSATAEIDVTGIDSGSWTITVEMTTNSVTGTATDPNGDSCTVSGTIGTDGNVDVDLECATAL